MHEITREMPNKYFIRGYSAVLLIRHGPIADYVAALDEASARIDELKDNPQGDVIVVARESGKGEITMHFSPAFLQDVQACAPLLHFEFVRQSGG